MHDSNGELLDRIIRDEPPASSKNEQLRKTLARWFEGRRNFVMFYMTLWALFSLVVFIPGWFVVFSGVRDTRVLFVATAGIIVGISLNVLVKLWYWIVDCKISVVKELKLMQLSMLDAAVGEDAADAGVDTAQLDRLLPEKFFAKKDSFFASVSPRTARWAATIGLVGGALLMLPLTQAIVPNLLPRSGVEQADVYHIDGSGRVSVRSALTYRSLKRNKTFATLALPYAEGEVVAISSGGEPLAYSKVDWRRYEVQLPLHPFRAEEFPEVLVEWTFPMDALLHVDDGYRTLLASLIPVDAYSLHVTLGENSGHTFTDPQATSIRPFQTWGLHGTTRFGWCGILMQPQAEAQ